MTNEFGLSVMYNVSAFYENLSCDRSHEIIRGESAEFFNIKKCGPNVIVKASDTTGSTLCQTNSTIPAPNFSIVPFIKEGVLVCIFSPET